jgi:two-component system, NtrC family, nitrogen regulation response regulator GlnG
MCDSRTLLLIVEDDAWTRKALTRLMRREGWRILTAATVAKGVEHLSSAPDCVILDLDLPDGCGESVLHSIARLGINIRVVVCTAAADQERLDCLDRLGPHAILRKPVDVDALLEACGAAGQGSR